MINYYLRTFLSQTEEENNVNRITYFLKYLNFS